MFEKAQKKRCARERNCSFSLPHNTDWRLGACRQHNEHQHHWTDVTNTSGKMCHGGIRKFVSSSIFVYVSAIFVLTFCGISHRPRVQRLTFFFHSSANVNRSSESISGKYRANTKCSGHKANYTRWIHSRNSISQCRNCSRVYSSQIDAPNWFSLCSRLGLCERNSEWMFDKTHTKLLNIIL